MGELISFWIYKSSELLKCLHFSRKVQEGFEEVSHFAKNIDVPIGKNSKLDVGGSDPYVNDTIYRGIIRSFLFSLIADLVMFSVLGLMQDSKLVRKNHILGLLRES